MRGSVLAGVIVIAGLSSAAGCSSAVTTTDTTTTDSTVATTSAPATAPTTSAPATAAPSTETPTTTEPAEREPIVLGFAGDTTLTDGLDQREPFAAVIEATSAPDLMVVNLETAVADPDVGRPPVAKQFLFKSPPASLDLLIQAGIDVVALGNNHLLDFGVDAVAQTLDEIDTRGLLRVGAGLDEVEAYEPLIVDVGDWTIGLVSLSRVPCDWSASGENVRPQVAWACPPFIDLAEAAAATAMAEADVAVVMIHGGEEGVLCPSPFMIELEERFAALGVDAVINGHPHVLQGVTRRGDTWVAHSLGNFAFPPSRGITGNSAIVQLLVSEAGVEMVVEPIRSDGGVLSIPSDDQRVAILDQVRRHSSGVAIDDDGRVSVDPEAVSAC